MNRTWTTAGSVLAFLGVALGAFGAHALKEKLGANHPIWETAVQYEFVHALALLFLGLAASSLPKKTIQSVGFLFTFGVVVFSGSLYVLAVTDIKILGAITPFGGLGFLTGWILLVIGINKGEPVSDAN